MMQLAEAYCPTDVSKGRVTVRPAYDSGKSLISLSRASASSENELRFALWGHLEAAPGWFVHKPILLKLERDADGSWTVADDEFLVYGVGDAPEEAFQDYVTSLVEYYHLVEAGACRADHDKVELGRLQSHLGWVPQA